MTDGEKKPSQPESSGQGVQLGVGTLIIIALIVTTCSGRSEIEKVQNDTAALKQQLEAINTKLDALTRNGGAITFGNVESPAERANAGATAPPGP